MVVYLVFLCQHVVNIVVYIVRPGFSLIQRGTDGTVKSQFIVYLVNEVFNNCLVQFEII